MKYAIAIASALLLVGCIGETDEPDVNISSGVTYLEQGEEGLFVEGVVTPDHPQTFVHESAGDILRVEGEIDSGVTMYSDNDPDTPLEEATCVEETDPGFISGTTTATCFHIGAAAVTVQGSGGYSLSVRPGIGTTPIGGGGTQAP